jgi:tetratricopeptide (TPR) repeat protein
LDQEKALQSYKMALAYYQRAGNLANTAICHNNVGEVLLTMGRIDEAIGELRKATEPYENREDSPFIFGLALVNLSRAYQRKHDYGPAFESVQHGIRHLKKIGARAVLTEATLQQAEIQLETGDITGALRTCQSSLKEAIEMRSTLLQVNGLRIMGRIRKNLQDYTRAEADLLESIALARHTGSRHEEGLSLLRLAELWRETGPDKAQRYRTAVRRATAILEKMGATGDLSIPL